MPDLLTERRDEILVITINRPGARNAINRAVAEGIAAALDELDGDGGLRAGVITGAGGYFSAGMDLRRSGPASGPTSPAVGSLASWSGRPPSR